MTELRLGELWPKLLLLEWKEKLLMWLLLLLSPRIVFDDMIITGALVASFVIDAAISWVCPTICTACRIAATSRNVLVDPWPPALTSNFHFYSEYGCPAPTAFLKDVLLITKAFSKASEYSSI